MPLSEKGAVRVLDAAAALASIAQYVEGETFETFLANAMLRAAVERKLEVVGEALTVFRRLDPATAATVADLPRAIRMRNFLAHDYGAVDDQIVWEVATVHGPALHAALARLLSGEAEWACAPGRT